MLSGLALVHRPFSRSREAAPLFGEGWASWRTCLREIVVHPRGAEEVVPLSPEEKLFIGEEAYRFLLEVVCGLHSRVPGENEIVGQFKRRFLEEPLPAEVASEFSRLSRWLLADMKSVRTRFPVNAGAHSYGSFCRKVSESASRVTILGAGELAVSILPWMKKKTRVRILYRSDAGRDRLLSRIEESCPETLSTLELEPIGCEALDCEGEALVIAAPIAASDVANLLGESRPSRIVDLRAEGATDALSVEGSEVVVLGDFFREAEASAAAAERAREAALSEIARLARARAEFEPMIIRTLGWEDLCG
jgi:glutamyl-tRNA reductase